MTAISHIQNTAPGPPVAIAAAMPAMLPVPTREAVEIIRAWKDDTCLTPSSSRDFSLRMRITSPMRRIWTKPVRMVKYTPDPISKKIRM